jgi:hypothetical protein
MDDTIDPDEFSVKVQAPLHPEPNWGSATMTGVGCADDEQLVWVIRPNGEEQLVPRSRLKPGMIVRLKERDTVPADMILIGGDQSKRTAKQKTSLVMLDTQPYDSVVAYDGNHRFLTEDPITNQSVSAMSIEVDGYCSSAVLNTWYGDATVNGEKWVNEKADGDYAGLDFKTNMLAYKMEVQSVISSEYIYGMCFFTRADCKYAKWQLEEDLEIQKQLLKHRRRGGGRIHRGKFAARRNLKIDKKPGVISLSDHRPKPQKEEKKKKPDDIKTPLTDDDDDDPTEDGYKKLLPTKNDKKKKMYWALIIGGITLVVLAIILIILFMFVLSSGSGSASVPAQIVITSATSSVSGLTLDLAFTQPSDNGGTISSYTCSATTGGVTTTATGSGTCYNSNCEFPCTGLTAGATYSVTIYATNGQGNSETSAAVSGTTTDSQKIFLEALYNGAGGANWAHDACPKDTSYTAADKSTQHWRSGTSFNSAGDYCNNTLNWGGISCDSNGIITNLIMDGLYLVGTIPTEVGYLTGLTNLNFARNPNHFSLCQTGAVGCAAAPANYCQFTLGQRGTDGGGLSGSIPTEIGLLTNLGTFNIQSTYISGTVPSEFDALTALIEFKISKAEMLCYQTADGTATGTASTADGSSCSAANSITSPASCSSSCTTFQTKLKNILDTTGYCCTIQDDGKTDLICDANQAC